MVTAFGQTEADSTDYTVRRPNRQITSVTTSVNILQVGDTVFVTFGGMDADGSPDISNPGIRFSRSVDLASAAVGEFRWTQLVSESIYLPHPDFTAHSLETGLDNKVSYGNAIDSPGVEFPTETVWAEECFAADMYLMFKSETPDSIWVPVQNVQWTVHWRAEKDANSVWSLVTSDWTHDPIGVDSVSFPTWTSVVHNGVPRGWIID